MDLRETLTRHRVDWRNKGPNCSSGFLNVQCPLCGPKDPSYHLRINETGHWWYCLRSTAHKGRTLGYLFSKLGISDSYLPEPERTQPSQVETKSTKSDDIPSYSLEFFESADLNEEALYYLSNRRVSFPREIAQKFNLKVAKNGMWAGRLIIPLTIGWTGRSMRTHIQPRYLATDHSGFFCYGKGLSGILVEGPIDGMKVASVTDKFQVIAVTGGVISPALLAFLRTRELNTLYCVPDSTVEPGQRASFLREIRLALPFVRVQGVRLPENFKDHGEMSENEIRAWIYNLT